MNGKSDPVDLTDTRETWLQKEDLEESFRDTLNAHSNKGQSNSKA